MYYIPLICVLISISEVHCQCSGQTKTALVGYSATSVSSENYDNGYPTDTTCSWKHSSSKTGSSLLVQINSTVGYPGDNVTMYDGTDNTGSLLHSCTDTTPTYVVATTGNLFTYFTTDSDFSPAEKGFKFNMISARDFSYDACLTQKTLLASISTQYISSPNFPEKYPKNTNCCWCIEKPDYSTTLELTFMFVDIEYEASGPCKFDFTTITDDGTGMTVLKTCGEDQWSPSITYSTKSNVTVRFNSDVTDQHRGFLLSYYILSSPTAEDDTTNCYFNNCVVLPVMVAVGGVLIIAIITFVIICVVSKQYHKKNIVISSAGSGLSLRKKTSIRNLIIPKFSRNRQSIKWARGPFNSKQFIPSKPPIATVWTSKLRHISDEKRVTMDSRQRMKACAANTLPSIRKNPRIPPALLKIVHETAKSKAKLNDPKKNPSRKDEKGDTASMVSSRDKKRILDALNSHRIVPKKNRVTNTGKDKQNNRALVNEVENNSGNSDERKSSSLKLNKTHVLGTDRIYKEIALQNINTKVREKRVIR